MANLIARAQGFLKDGRPKASQVTRLGVHNAKASVATWQIAGEVEVRKDGAGGFMLRDLNTGERLVDVVWDATRKVTYLSPKS